MQRAVLLESTRITLTLSLMSTRKVSRLKTPKVDSPQSKRRSPPAKAAYSNHRSPRENSQRQLKSEKGYCNLVISHTGLPGSSVVPCSTLGLAIRVVDSPSCHLEAAWKTSAQHRSLNARASGERASFSLPSTVSG